MIPEDFGIGGRLACWSVTAHPMSIYTLSSYQMSSLERQVGSAFWSSCNLVFLHGSIYTKQVTVAGSHSA